MTADHATRPRRTSGQARGARRSPRTTPEPPPQAVMGLLNYITATSIDEDYAESSHRRGGGGPGTRRPGTMAMVVLAVFGILVATAAVQTSRSADDNQTTHDELVKQINARKGQLADRRQRAAALRRETGTLETQFLQATAKGRSLQSRLSRLGLAVGAVATRGPGVEVVVDNGPPVAGGKNEVLDVDLQKLVNGLWLAGAEAVSINGERLTSLSAIRLAFPNITVNYRELSRPYTVSAIGDPDTLPARFLDTEGGQWWLDLQALYGVKFDISSVNPGEPQTLPAADRLTLRHAHTPETLR